MLKRRLLLGVVIFATLTLSACVPLTNLLQIEHVEAAFGYVARTHTDEPGMDHWLPRIVLWMEVVPEPQRLGGHEWSVDWGDGTSTTWSDNSRSQREAVYDSPEQNWIIDWEYPWGNARVAPQHKYCRPGAYTVSATYDGKLITRGDITVELVESRPSYVYNEDGDLVPVVYDPWTPDCEDGS